MKLDISDETLGHFIAAFLETKPGILSIMLVSVKPDAFDETLRHFQLR